MQLGTTAIAVRTDEGVVLAVEKRVTSTLLVRKLVLKRAIVSENLSFFLYFKLITDCSCVHFLFTMLFQTSNRNHPV